MEPSEQQKAIYKWVKKGEGSAIINAVAGAGKTTTLIEAVKLMDGTVAFAAYNKKIADEIKARMPNNGNAEAGTFHSFGMKAWRQVSKEFQVDGRKVNRLIEDMDIPPLFRGFSLRAVGLAKQWGIGIENGIESQTEWMNLVEHYDLEQSLADYSKGEVVDPETLELAIDYAVRVLKASNAIGTKCIDFDDMIYLPLLHNVKFWQRDWVLVDEAQDTNPTRRLLAQRMLKPKGRLVAVGDPYQAIYGFTGANSDAMDIIKRTFNCTELNLSVTYRCPKAVVKVAQRYVPHIEAHETAPEGIYRGMPNAEFITLDKYSLDATSAVLCRNTKPLVELAFSFIARDIACHVEGKDIGLSLLKLIDRWQRLRTLELLADKLRDYKDTEVKKLMDSKKEVQAELLEDKVDCLLTIIQMLPPGSDVLDLRNKIDRLFGDTPEGKPSPNLTLSTIHKAKGREWNRVYWYGPNVYQPSKYAKKPWQKEQETNLFYVAATRAKSELVEVMVSL